MTLLHCLMGLGAVLFVAGCLLPDRWMPGPALKNYASPDETREVPR